MLQFQPEMVLEEMLVYEVGALTERAIPINNEALYSALISVFNDSLCCGETRNRHAERGTRYVIEF